ncbi:MAG: adhesin [Myxococcales bacterium]|nr:adhesin [Myxococcales bacterium]
MLPNADRAVVGPAKVRDYLLSPEHPVGRFKAAFFRALGYSADQWELLRADLQFIAQTGDATPTELGPFGQKFEVRATLSSPLGRTAKITAVWIVRTGEDFPRFVTAFPA